MPYRDDVPRVSIAQLRAQFTPRAFRALARAKLEVDGVIGEVSLVDGEGQGFVRGARRWFACPRCGRRVNVLGAVDALGWVCLTCGGWRSRNRARPRRDDGVAGRDGDAAAPGTRREAPTVPGVTEERFDEVRTGKRLGVQGLLAILMGETNTAPTDAESALGGRGLAGGLRHLRG